MAAWTEQQERDRLMHSFIAQDPLTITLHRPVWAATQAGGKTRTDADDVDPQVFAIYPFKRRLTVESRYNPQTFGEEKVEYIHWILIFDRGADIQVDDEFDPSADTDPVTDRLQAGLYQVVFISAREWDRGQAGLLYRGAG